MELKESIRFEWSHLGNIDEGRPNLGQMVPVNIYRLMQFTMRDVLSEEFGDEEAKRLLCKSGKLAGESFCENVLNVKLPFPEFISQVKEVLKDLKVGILRLERADMENMNMIITIAEDLDCSGLPFLDDVICDYDEGFLSGILMKYTGEEFSVKEVDCWAKGDRVCRFEIKPL